MKASENTLAALADLQAVQTTGDIRRIVATACLALVRKEISATDLEAVAKGLEAVSNSIAADIKKERLRIDMHKTGGGMGGAGGLSQTLLGS